MSEAKVKVEKLVDAGNQLIEFFKTEMGIDGDLKITPKDVENMTGDELIKLTQLSSRLSNRSLDLENEVWNNIQLNQIKH